MVKKPSDRLKPDCEGPFRFYPVGNGGEVLKKLSSVIRFEIKKHSSSEELR